MSLFNLDYSSNSLIHICSSSKISVQFKTPFGSGTHHTWTDLGWDWTFANALASSFALWYVLRLEIALAIMRWGSIGLFSKQRVFLAYQIPSAVIVINSTTSKGTSTMKSLSHTFHSWSSLFSTLGHKGGWNHNLRISLHPEMACMDVSFACKHHGQRWVHVTCQWFKLFLTSNIPCKNCHRKIWFIGGR